MSLKEASKQKKGSKGRSQTIGNVLKSESEAPKLNKSRGTVDTISVQTVSTKSSKRGRVKTPKGRRSPLDRPQSTRVSRTPQPRGGKKTKKKRTFSDAQKKAASDDEKDEFELPTWDVVSTIPPMIDMSAEAAVNTAFDEFDALLKAQRQKCLQLLQSAPDTQQSITIQIDVEGTTEHIKNIGTVLGGKEYELNKEQTHCIEKLREILYFDETAKVKREEATTIQQKVQDEIVAIEERTAQVAIELEKAKPALDAAKAAVQGISKKQMDELRALPRPPELVKAVMTAVLVLTGSPASITWRDIREKLKFEFIEFIVDFDPEKVSAATRKTVTKTYLAQSDFTFERVNKASKVAGPLVLWLRSQMEYARLLDIVKPITDEIKRLKRESNRNQKRAERLTDQLFELEKRVKEARLEMMAMVRHIVQLRDDMKEARKQLAVKPEE